MANDAAFSVAVKATAVSTINGGDVNSDHDLLGKNNLQAGVDVHAKRDLIADRNLIVAGSINAASIAIPGGVVATSLQLVWYDAIAGTGPGAVEGMVRLFFNADATPDGTLTIGSSNVMAAVRGGIWVVV
jgi:hypothetical protein